MPDQQAITGTETVPPSAPHQVLPVDFIDIPEHILQPDRDLAAVELTGKPKAFYARHGDVLLIDRRPFSPDSRIDFIENGISIPLLDEWMVEVDGVLRRMQVWCDPDTGQLQTFEGDGTVWIGKLPNGRMYVILPNELPLFNRPSTTPPIQALTITENQVIGLVVGVIRGQKAAVTTAHQSTEGGK